MEQNFQKIGEIEAEGVKHPDWLLQHNEGWYARVRAQRVRDPASACAHCGSRLLSMGVKPGMLVSVFAGECDADGNLVDDPLESRHIISPPVDGAQKIDWTNVRKSVVRHALDELLKSRSELPDIEIVKPLTR